MKIELILIGLFVCVMFANIAVAESQYGKIDSYYNDRFLPGTEIAKPNLKIGEPFKLRVDVTMYQECKMYVSLSLLDKTHFEFIDGPADFSHTASYIFETNETHKFEWTLKPTDGWAGGSVPVNIHYSILVLGVTGSVADSSFTIAYPHISTEYYEGDTTTIDPESPLSTPAFTFLAAALAIIVAAGKS